MVYYNYSSSCYREVVIVVEEMKQQFKPQYFVAHARDVSL